MKARTVVGLVSVVVLVFVVVQMDRDPFGETALHNDEVIKSWLNNASNLRVQIRNLIDDDYWVSNCREFPLKQNLATQLCSLFQVSGSYDRKSGVKPATGLEIRGTSEFGEFQLEFGPPDDSNEMGFMVYATAGKKAAPGRFLSTQPPARHFRLSGDFMAIYELIDDARKEAQVPIEKYNAMH